MKKQNITLSFALAAVFSSSVAFAEAEVTGKIVHESATFTESGIGIGAATTLGQTADSHSREFFKHETSARIFIDGDVKDSAYHVELNAFNDFEGVGDYESNESYTQRDFLREAYIDTEVKDFSIRAGKQQVVWGTADGMKLLDVINPTDYSEMAQNQMEDSRIPVWMLNAEKDTADGGSLQFIVSEGKSNKIAGLGQESAAATSHTNGDAGHAFIMKGVDSITGKVNGFMNVAPALGKVANYFVGAAGGGTALYDSWQAATVNEFSNSGSDAAGFAGLCAGSGKTTAYCLQQVANSATQGQNAGVTNLSDVVTSTGDDGSIAPGLEYDATNPNSAFEYMDHTTFATFYAFDDLQSKYVVDHEKNGKGNIGFKYKNSTPSGLNYSLNYLNHLDPNPSVDMHWEDSNGVKLTTVYLNTNGHTTVYLDNGGGAKSVGGSASNPTARLIFTETLERINSYGGSFDTAVETASLGPVVLRGEFLYDQGVKSPVIDLAKLDIGDLTGALTMQEGDRFSYVLGADITRLTNMMVSLQFIQVVDLDYIDETHTPVVGGVTSAYSGKRFTGDRASMSMSNGFNKAEEFKEFYSIFLSKPFGASSEHRWNNITMLEDTGGRWNRFDIEYSVNDDTQAIFEVNSYFGNEDTQFGQLAKSSNVQVGVKYSF
ncbi:MAG TPA: RNA polymerase-associated protein rapA [Candidatus Thioglobus sp.]|nr:RNA polymerase-associated protein rapA [Candidatus Thioglobus sp.]